MKMMLLSNWVLCICIYPLLTISIFRPLSASVLAVACQSAVLIWHIEPTSLAARFGNFLFSAFFFFFFAASFAFWPVMVYHFGLWKSFFLIMDTLMWGAVTVIGINVFFHYASLCFQIYSFKLFMYTKWSWYFEGTSFTSAYFHTYFIFAPVLFDISLCCLIPTRVGLFWLLLNFRIQKAIK